VTTGTLEEIHWEILSHPIYSSKLAPSDFQLFGPLIEALEGKGFKPGDEVKFLCKDHWTS
jgi:hypothetical protein